MGRGGSDQSTAVAPRRYDPQSALARCTPIGEPAAFQELPVVVREDDDLRDNLDARYGGFDSMRFQLIEMPIDLVRHCAVDEEHFEDMIASDEDWEAEAQDSDEDPDFEFEDAANRLVIMQDYRKQFAAGDQPAPIVVDFYNMDDNVDLLDGYHRVSAAVLEDRATIKAYHLLPDE